MGGGGNLPIGPGVGAFVAFFVLALALWFLVHNMNARLRRMAYRDRERAEREARLPEGARPTRPPLIPIADERASGSGADAARAGTDGSDRTVGSDRTGDASGDGLVADDGEGDRREV